MKMSDAIKKPWPDAPLAFLTEATGEPLGVTA